MSSLVKNAFRSLFPRKKPEKKRIELLPGAISHRITVLNTDDDATSGEAADWLLKCIFREDDLYAYAVSELAPHLTACKTFKELNQAIFKHFQAKIDGQQLEEVDAMDLRAYHAVLSHQTDTRKNRNAYRGKMRHLPESGYWPNPTDTGNARSLYTELPIRRRPKFITKDTRLTSLGSCFADEIARELQRGGFHYIVTERNVGGFVVPDEPGGMSDTSAAWGSIFNNPSFRQLVERAFGLRDLPRILWSDKEYFMDPFRENIRFKTIEEYASTYDRHISCVREALIQAEVLIITLGLNEIWSFKMDGSVFSRSPWRIAPSFVEFRTLTVEENAAELQRMLDVLRRFNPGIKVIVTVSPIPLHATFLHETYHVVEANAHSKAVLRVAAQQFVEKNEGVYYFPSFELVTFNHQEPWGPDQRHASRPAVARVMQMFHEMFVV